MAETPQADQIAAAYGAGALDAGAAVLLGEVPDGAELLHALVDEVEGYDDARTRVAAVVALLADPDQLDAVGLAYRRRRAPVLAELMRLEALPGMKRHARTLQAAIRDAAGAAAGRAAPQEFDGHTYTVPAGWSVDEEGVWQVHMRGGEPRPVLMAHAPLILRRRLSDVDDRSELCEVAWMRGARWRHAIVPRSEIADARALLKLSAQGAPVHSGSSSDAVRWLADFEAANLATLPMAYGSRRMGWVGSARRYFLAGHELVHAEAAPEDIRLLDTDPGTAQLAAAFAPSGTWEGWLEAFAAVRGYPSAVLAVYAACCAPLLGVVPEAPNFAIDWSGRSGSGKTTSLQLAASVWGRPEEGAGVIRSWLGSLTGIERTAAGLDHLPLFLDESNKVPEAQRPALGSLVYMVVNGSGKLRGALSGSQATASWRTVLLSTGESRVVDYTQNEGARARVISVVGPPLGPDNAALAEATRAELLTHHGHLGARWVRWLLGQRSRWAEFTADYKARVARWRSSSNGNIADRAAQYVALLDLAADLLMEAGLLTRPDRDPVAYAWRCALEGGATADRAAAALTLAFEAAAAAPTAFYGRHEIRPGTGDIIAPTGGWRGAWAQGEGWTRIGFFPEQLTALLKSRGYEPEGILNAWKARGWLKVNASGTGNGRTYPMGVGGARPKLIVVERAAFRAVGAEAPEGGSDE